MIMKNSGINLEQVKINNKSTILKLINEKGPLSRKDIADETGLTPASVTQITTALLSDGLLSEKGTDETVRSTAGRRKVFLDINPEYLFGVTVNLDPENTTVAVINAKGEAILKDSFKTDKEKSADDFLRKVSIRIDSITDKLPREQKDKIKTVSISVPGPVDRENGIAGRAYGIWKESVAIKSALEGLTGKNIIVSNNVDAFSKAELLFGEGRKWENLFIIKWGPGVGSSIVIDGKIYEGRHKKTAEIGHVIVDREGKKCACGRIGCLGTKISYQALNKITRFSPEDFGTVFENAKKKERKDFEDAISLFAECIVNAGVLIAPNRIVLEGSLLQSEVIRNALIESCKELDPAYDENRIVFSSLYDKEDHIGPAAELLAYELF